MGDDNVLIGRNHWDVPVRVELRAYLRFGRRMDHQLRRLVLRWAHTAAPHSRATAIEPLQVYNNEP
ncbi:MAG: hypothetical protein WCB27_19820 [Thermoguttaceae bacterium]|jgi:hypothetical protein